MVSGAERLAAIGIENCSLPPRAGHALTKREHVCGEFKDEFDWASLPLDYRKRVGELAKTSLASRPAPRGPDNEGDRSDA